MKKIFTHLLPCALFLVPCTLLAQTGSVGIGTTTPHSSAALDVQSTEKGMLVPRMTTAQRTAISNAATGLLVFDNTTGTFWFYNGNAWTELVGGGGNSNWSQNGNNIYNSNTGNVGIGVSNPSYRLSLKGGIGLYNFEGAYGYIQNTNVTHDNLIGNLSINADAGNLISQTPSQDIILQYATGLGVTSGKVGIGTDNPIQKLDVNGSIRVSDEINRTNTGTANLLPIAYGVVGADGTILSGTGNFTVTLEGITILGPPNGFASFYVIDVAGISINQNNAVIQITPISDFPRYGTITPFFTGYGGDFNVMFNYLEDEWPPCQFSFIVYRL